MREPHPFLASAVRREVVHRHLDALPLLQLPEDGDEQLEVKRVGVVEVVLVFGRQLLLVFIQHLETDQDKDVPMVTDYLYSQAP